ncbi:MAG: hypothetical protein QNJ72_21590 [Pleurocapsa sp. MO_226.B13]|nr:hypothetical protein [Pleurocapsa sp. MO_226.B13]
MELRKKSCHSLLFILLTINFDSGVFTILDIMEKAQSQANNQLSTKENLIVIFLGGDVMTGRGIDQILPHPSDPFIPEPYLK